MTTNRSIANYDKYLCLKPNPVMWLIFIFLMKPYIVAILSVVNRRDKTGLIDMVYSDRTALALGAVAAVPVALLVYALMKRKPGATQFVKSVWARGRMLLVVSALASVGVVFFPPLAGSARHLTDNAWIQIAIAAVIVVIVFRSSYIRDCFNDFPEDVAADGKAKDGSA